MGLRKNVTIALVGPSAVSSSTHPDILARIAQFNTVAIPEPAEFAALKGFRTASGRVMTSIAVDLANLLDAIPPDLRARLQEFAQPTR